MLRREKMEITLPTLIELFVTTKQTEGRSPKTVTWYRDRLSRFAKFMGNGSDARLKDLTLEDARAFVAHLQDLPTRYDGHPLKPRQEGGLSPSTIHSYVRALKAFSSWLHEEEFTSRNVLAKLKRPRVPKPVIQILSDEEISAIFKAISPNSFLGARLHVIALLLLDTGIRASELCGLTIESTSLKEDYIKVLGKGEKERMVPFGATTKKALLRYLHTFRPEPVYPNIDNLVLSVAGYPLSYHGLAQAIKRLGVRAGVPRLHAHLFRHTFAVRYLMNGGDIMTLRLILGHSTLEVTQMYLHLASAHIRIQHHKFSPVDRLGIRVRGSR
jgi:integrase/recombinase XerC/integrase/recombinase XerD